MPHSYQPASRLKCASHVLRLFGIILVVPVISQAQDTAPTEQKTPVETVTISGNLLGTGLQQGLQKFAGSRTVMSAGDIQDSGASTIEDALRHIPGVQVTDNSSSGGSNMSLNIGVRGLDGRFSPRSTVLVDGVPLAVAPYGQPQLSFAPVSLNSIESIDVVRGGGAVRYGPQNVGGIINFTTRPIPSEAFTGDATVRYNHFSSGGRSQQNNRQYSVFMGGQHDDGIGMALLYSGSDGSGWRQHSGEHFNDISLKTRYEISPQAEIYSKLGYYEATADVPGGLSAAQYAADPFQSQHTHDFWQGRRSSIDLGYINTLSADQEVEIKTYFNSSFRSSGLANNVDSSATSINLQPRNYTVFGFEPRFTQRLQQGEWRHDITVGYRYVREGSSENSINQNLYDNGSVLKRSSQNNTYANSVYIDDQIAWHQWRITPGLRYESVNISRTNKLSNLNGFSDGEHYRQPLPALAIAYIASPALTLFANYTTSFASVQFLQLNLQNYNNELQAEIARTTEFGVRWNQNGLKWDANVFDLRFNNQIQYINPYYINQGKTHHRGIETSIEYELEKFNPALSGLSVYATYAYTKATLESGAQSGNDLPFYSRNVDSQGIRYKRNGWTFNLSSTHQSGQYADDANTLAESADGTIGWIPGYRLWNAQIDWKPGSESGLEFSAGINNLMNRGYFSRTIDTNAGKLAGAPRMVYLQVRAMF